MRESIFCENRSIFKRYLEFGPGEEKETIFIVRMRLCFVD